MKKSLLALAALGAFAGAAQAQSSVTVYGTLDLAGAKTDTGITANGVTTGLLGGGLVSDRLGFKGNEDLGGGTSAFFQIETGMAPFTANAGTAGSGSGLAATPDTPGSFLTTRREMFVGLADKTLGSIQGGSMYSPGFNFAGFGDAAGFNVMGTNLSHATVVSSVPIATGASTTGSSTASFKMNANALKYTSPTMAGLTLTLYNVMQQSVAVGGAGRVNAVQLDYALGNFSARSVLETKQVATNGPITKHTTTGIGAGYDFGFANIRAGYQKGDLATVGSTTATVAISKVTFLAPVSNTIDIHGGYATITANAADAMYTVAGTTGKAGVANIGVQYKMSKRTALYGYYTQINNDVGTRVGLTDSAAGIVSVNPTRLAIGMRHTF